MQFVLEDRQYDLPKDQLAKFGITAGQWAADNLGPNTFKKRFDSLLAEL